MFPLGCGLIRGNFIEGDLIGQCLPSVWIRFVAANKNPCLSSITFTHVRYRLHGTSHATAAVVRRLTVTLGQLLNKKCEHIGKMSKRLGGIIGCKYKTSSWQLLCHQNPDLAGHERD